VTLFEDIYKLYFKDVLVYVQGLSGDKYVAEEITEETFYKALKNLSKFKGSCDIRVWLCQIAKNSYYSYCRKHNRTTDKPPSETLVTDCYIENKFIEEETALRIHCFLHDMNEPYKEVFSLRVFGELSFEQIGKVFGKTESWARVTYHRAKAKIIEFLEEENNG
jgi:RNA polymerase sigma-70 factor, ECF subfamily